jgi:hypothetical protein
MQDFKKIFVKVPQPYLDLINQVFEIEKKTSQLKEENSLQRNINKLKDLIENELFKSGEGTGLTYHNPLGEKYSQSRTDCEGNIAGTHTDNLEIVEVIKPIIFYNYIDNNKAIKTIAQKAVIVAEARN